jgi:endonuclease/exonuclease/phosphatase (EEP) superfamily protein YafD
MAVLVPKGGRGSFRLSTRLSSWGLLGALGTVVCSLTACGFAGRFGWLVELTSHFRVQCLWSLAALAGVHVLGRRWRSATLFGLFAAVNLWVVAPYLGSRDAPSDQAVGTFRILLLNVHTENTRYELVRALLREMSPDVVVLEEVNDRWLRELPDLQRTHPFSIRAPRDDNFGMALFSQRPLRDPRVINLGEARVPSVAAGVEMAGTTVTVVGTHPLPPGSPEQLRLRDGQLTAVGAFLRGQKGPWVLVGDLNATPWSRCFEELIRATGLTDTARGGGLRGTWPVGLPVMRIPIDHCLVSERLEVVNRKVGPDVGSDHFPVVTDLRLTR